LNCLNLWHSAWFPHVLSGPRLHRRSGARKLKLLAKTAPSPKFRAAPLSVDIARRRLCCSVYEYNYVLIVFKILLHSGIKVQDNPTDEPQSAK
jgi:hypothetical protein